MTIMFNLHTGIMRVEFERSCCGVPDNDRIHAHYNRMSYDVIG